MGDPQLFGVCQICSRRSDFGEELFAGNYEGSNGLYYEVKRWNLSELKRVA